MKTNKVETTSQADGEQVVRAKKYQVIKLGIDWHAEHFRVVRIIEGAGPEPAQRFSPPDFLAWAKKQTGLAEKVFSCYEAGAGGFVLHRQLTERGVSNYVVAPTKLDPAYKGVCTDKTDARELALNLERYVGGNLKALRLVYVPSPQQEQARQQTRQRQQLREHRQALAAQGRCLLLAQGWRRNNSWWKPACWKELQSQLPAWLLGALEIYRQLILQVDQPLQELTRTVQAAAAKVRPAGLGALSLEIVRREICDWKRFKNRKQPGSYAGLVGGVSASGPSYYELSLTKAGNVRLRTVLIELAWRMVVYQSQCPLIQRWKHILLNPKASGRAKKRAIVAVARRLLIDLWRWQTGQVTAGQLGWLMLDDKSGRVFAAC
jgi:transposase